MEPEEPGVGFDAGTQEAQGGWGGTTDSSVWLLDPHWTALEQMAPLMVVHSASQC